MLKMAQLKEQGGGGEERKETFLPLLFPHERPKKSCSIYAFQTDLPETFFKW